VVLAIIAIAKGLGLTLVAEGVETLTQMRYLENSGCNLMQGYYFHKPLPQPRILELIKAQTGQSGLFSGFSAFSES
jgi:EAL domain-containing protein (putative c-di-GMP-specific phosphodiesterase class I)